MDFNLINLTSSLPDVNLEHEQYGYSFTLFTFKEKVCLIKEIDQVFKYQKNSCQVFEIIGVRLIERKQKLKLIDHPYWLYLIQNNLTNKVQWVREYKLDKAENYNDNAIDWF